MTAFEARRDTLLAYCRIDDPAPEDLTLLEDMCMEAMGYLHGAGVTEPETGSPRLPLYNACVNALVLGRPERGQGRFRQPGLPTEAEPAEADGTRGVRIGHRAERGHGMNRAYLKSVYEAVRDRVDLTVRQRELFEAWLYTERTFAQLANQYGVNRSTVFRTVERAAQYVGRTAKRLDAHRKAATH